MLRLVGFLTLLLRLRFAGGICTLESLLQPDAACPRFVAMEEMSGAGMGDQLAHMFTLMAVACQMGHTVVIDDEFGLESRHLEGTEGYLKELEYLGVPLGKMMRQSSFEQYGDRLRIFDIEISRAMHIRMEGASKGSSFPCYSAVAVNMSSCHHTWCFSVYSNQIHSLIYSHLQSMISSRTRLSVPPPSSFNLIKQPMNRINIIWHIRLEGNNHPNINSPIYYRNVYSYLTKHLKNIPHHITVLAESISTFDHKFHFLKTTNNNNNNHKLVSFHADYSVIQSIDLMLNCDVLFYTGSSFPTSIIWLSELDRPVVLESISKEQYFVDNVRQMYQLPEGRSIRLNESGLPLYDYGNNDYEIIQKLMDVGRLELQSDGKIRVVHSGGGKSGDEPFVVR